MKLRGRLLLVTGVVVLLPLLGLQFLGGVERLLRQGQEQAVLAGARALTSILPLPDTVPVAAGGFYVHAARQPLLLDGYGDDWQAWLDVTDRFGPGVERVQRPPDAALSADRPLALALAEAPAGLHVLIRMRDTDVRFAAPGAAGERVELRLAGSGGSERLVIEPAAPGGIARTLSAGAVVRGDWQVHAAGWNLELRIPGRVDVDALGVNVVDVDADGRARLGSDAPRPLIRRAPALDALLARNVPPGARAWIVDPAGWVLADAARGASPNMVIDAYADAPSPWQALLFERLAGDALARTRPPGPFAARLTGPDVAAAANGAVEPVWMMLTGDERAPGARVRVAVPMNREDGAGARLVLERDADALMLLASDAMLRLVGISLLTFVLAAGVLLAFAAWLSLRIRRLQRSAERAVADDGRVTGRLSPADGSDELADLSRSMGRLLERLRVHQQYLRTLADRLAHELRTPLTMIDSSLNNLDQRLDEAEPANPAELRRYIERAGQGSRRLNAIFRAMSQAARLEEALIDEPFERFDLAALAHEYCAARAADAAGPLVGPEAGVEAFLNGSPDLVCQLLDKLVDNALGFVSNEGRVEVGVAAGDGAVRVWVENDGPRIDAAQAESLFEPMVSHRRSAGEVRHLGLGLFIARLIVERHGGRIEARPTARGTRVECAFPRVDPETSQA
jgi:signal transduction histidine kinase